jgi:hypothetical protein
MSVFGKRVFSQSVNVGIGDNKRIAIGIRE